MRTFTQIPKATQQTSSAQRVKASPMASKQHHDVQSILQLQRSLGNQAVQRLMPTNSESLEVEPSIQATPRFGHDFSRIPVHTPATGAIQTKLAIRKPGDRYEQEADRVASKVMSTPEPQLQRASPCSGECPKCRGERSVHDRLQAKHVHANHAVENVVPPIVDEVLRSPGQPLDGATRAFMEPRFGHDFSRVRVHSDTHAAVSAQAVNALAYTVGHHVVFGAGQYTPGSGEGRQLLAHELTHVMQQHSAPHLIQRQAALSEATAVPTEAADIDSQILLVQQAIEQLYKREAEDESGEMAEHIRNLTTGLNELQRVKASGTLQEQMQIVNHFAALSQETLRGTSPAPLLQRWAIGMGASADPLEQEAHALADYITQDVFHQRQPATAPRPVTATYPRIQRAAPAVAVAVGVAAGPPGWVVLAAAALGVAVVGGVYLATRPRTYERAEERAEPRVEPRVVPRTCATVYPAALRCESLPGSFTYSSPQAALQALKLSTGKSNLRLVSPNPSTGGPCPSVGMHYGVKDGGVYIASISCCPCCRDTPTGPVMTTLCRII
jgi:hypothetical protein